MTIFARLVLLLIWSLLALFLIFMWGLAFAGDFELVFEIFELPADLAAPPTWAVFVGSALMMATIASLGWAFLNMSHMLRKSERNKFSHLATYLRKSAWGFIGFWLLSGIVARAVPELLAVNADPSYAHEFDWIPIDLEMILLAVGITFLALSQSLRHAQEIEDDSKTIV